MNVVCAVSIIAFLALVYSFYLFIKVRTFGEGTEEMVKIAIKIRDGASVYLKRQYKVVSVFFAVVFCILFLFSLFSDVSGRCVPYFFLFGAFLSGLSGFIGMRTATMSNVRTAAAARSGLPRALSVAFSAGSVIGFLVVGVGLLGLCLVAFLSEYYFKHFSLGSTWSECLKLSVPNLLSFGMGISCMSLFARVGGGIFTKAADVGADLVGKVEVGIPEDDSRNPAVIADNVGDNVGDVAGMSSDLFESFVNSIISCAVLSFSSGFGLNGFYLPFVIAAFGILCSMIGSFFVKTVEGAGQVQLLQSLRRGIYISDSLICLSSFFVLKFLLPEHLNLFWPMFFGQISGLVVGYCTEYYTSSTYGPVRKLAKSAKTGAGPVVIEGLSLGMLSTFYPLIIIAIVIIFSFFSVGGALEGGGFMKGLYGISLAAVGMLSTLGITVATDAYGPIADNAGGIAEMADLPKQVRERTDALDSLGNTTAATGKGFAIGSASITSLALVGAYINETQRFLEIKGEIFPNLSVLNPSVLIGLLLGGMLPFLFSAFTMNAVGKAAMSVVEEVRRQFKEIPGLIEGNVEPDYQSCVDICTKSSLRQMVLPALVGFCSPIIVGLFGGPPSVAGVLIGAGVSGTLLALTMSNAGGAWDNSKKYIESGHFGGKGSESYKAAVVGDTVGDPFKDTSGPSINILVKLLSMVAIVFAGTIVYFHLI